MQLKLETTEEQLVDALRLNTRLLAELSARYAGEEMPERPDDMQTIQCAEDVARVVGDMRDLMQEQLRVLVLNNKHAVLEQRVIYQGTVNSCSIRVAEILRPAIVANAPAIVIVHNHPSGDPTPSPEDILVTRRIEQSARLMDIELLDHIVLGESSLTSMKSMGLGF